MGTRKTSIIRPGGLIPLLALLTLLSASFAPATPSAEAHTPSSTKTRLEVAVSPSASQIVAGGFHTCSLTAGGGVKCWGANTYGQLGDGTTIQRNMPVDVEGLTSGVIALAAGKFHTCAVLSDATVKCWGANTYGQLGDGTTAQRNTPVAVKGLTTGVTALAAGESHTCAVTAGGAMCWGSNWNGQLGDGTTTARSAPAPVSNLTDGVAALAAGGWHTCALMDAAHGGGVKCWGDNFFGELGDGTTTRRATPTAVSHLANGVTALAAGAWHTCALMDAGHGGGVKCWGLNSFGQVAEGAAVWQTTPAEVNALANNVVALAAGFEHTCALLAGGGVKCWGWNDYGHLGDGTTTARHLPVEVSGLAQGAVALAAGWYHTCAMMDAGHGGGVKCWGDDQLGQLGDGAYRQRSPVEVSALAGGVVALAAGPEQTCAIVAGAQEARCWGENTFGQLGDNTTVNRTSPVEVNSLTDGVTGLAAGGAHTCAIVAGGVVKCWGSNYFGQLGDGAAINRTAPVEVSALPGGMTALAAGEKHTCGLTVTGGIKCWGDNASGQLGIGSTRQRNTPTDVGQLIGGVMAVAAGREHTCALTAGGGVKCWGANNSGQLGDGTTTGRNSPVDVAGLSSGVAALAAGGDHTCALMTGGGVKCWGANDFGQVGDGTLIARDSPTEVTGLASRATGLAAGANHTCAVMAEGGLKCWGDNTFGQLGDGATISRNSPVDVSGLASGVTAVAAGREHTCALTGSTLKCWGADEYGQLGLGTILQRFTPVDVLTTAP